MRVWGWTAFGSTPLYVPRLLLDVACLTGNINSGLGLVATTYLADTITLTYGDSSAVIISPANDVAGSVKLDVCGSRWIQFDFTDGAGVLSMNALWWPVS